jgi:hypothetical protein
MPAWHATQARLDAKERLAREPVERRRLTAPEIVDYTRSLPRLWADAAPRVVGGPGSHGRVAGRPDGER